MEFKRLLKADFDPDPEDEADEAEDADDDADPTPKVIIEML
jgi:hypothetical protein